MKTNCCNSSEILKIGGDFLCMNHSCYNYLGGRQPIKRKKYFKKITVLTVFGIYLLFSVDDYSMVNRKEIGIYRNAKTIQIEPLSEESLKKELIINQLLCPEEVKAQIMLESGNLGSELLKKTNNMLGMRFPFSRKTTAIGLYLPAKDTIIYGKQEDLKRYRNANQYAVYMNWQDAVRDYKCWQMANFSLSENYLNFLGNVYAEDTAYANKIKQMALAKNKK